MLTVLIATRNGARTLPGVLEAHAALERPDGGWKLVVVDNGSTDRTKQIIESFQARLPLTYVFEPQEGKNAALNAGLQFVSGDLVVFTDDDTFPRKDWLVRLRAAADSQPASSIFGGLVVPRWESAPPDWILNWVPLGPAFGISDSRLQDGPVPPGQAFGANIAIRAEAFTTGQRFDTAVGPRRSGGYPMGSETEFVRRLVAQGASVCHVHGAVVEHFVPSAFFEPSWLVERARRFGRGRYRLEHAGQNDQVPNPKSRIPTWFMIPRYLFRRIARAMASMLGAALRADPEALFRSRWEFNYLCGQAVEARILGKEVGRRRL